MANITIKQLLFRNKFTLVVSSHRNRRSPLCTPKIRVFEEANRKYLEAHRNARLELSEATVMPGQYKHRPKPSERRIATKDRKLAPLHESLSPHRHTKGYDLAASTTWFDPLFNPHLHEGRYKVDPNEEPFNAIYNDSKSEMNNEYTKSRNITTPELWQFVERLARIKIAPKPNFRKEGEPITALPSGFVLPPENPPDLPYFVPRTRNYLLPVYYRLDTDPEKCFTEIKQVAGDLWRLEEDLRTHLEGLLGNRVLTSVCEPDELVRFRGKHLREVSTWLYNAGF